MRDENRNLKRLNTRQERELRKFVDTEGDLPIIMRAHNEETRVLKLKMKQVIAKNNILDGNCIPIYYVGTGNE